MQSVNVRQARSGVFSRLALAVCAASAAACGAAETPAKQAGHPRGAAGSGWTGDAVPVVWESVKVDAPPVIDGRADDVWANARPLTVWVREAMGGDHPKAVTLRAVHTDDSFYVLAAWDDPTRSDRRDPFVWNAEKRAYERPSKPDDQFALQFPMTTDFAISMLTVTRSYKADVWHWKAGRGNPLGWVDDKFHLISQAPIDHPKAVKHALHGGRAVHILRAQDSGKPAYVAREPPGQHEGDQVDSFLQQEPDGSMADVRGKGVHDGKGWTLEMGRAFNTGHPEDDAVVDPNADNRCAIALLDDELYEEHSVSSQILLRFVDPKAGQVIFDFEGDKVSAPADGFTATMTGAGAAGEWVVRDDVNRLGRTKVLAQERADQTNARYPLCVVDRVTARDVDVSVDFKPVSGRTDQAAGIVWRLEDKDNFFVVRANALENNVVAYKTVRGKRSSIGVKGDGGAYGVNVPVDAEKWHNLRVRAVGTAAEIYLDGRKVFEVENDSFTKPGKVGLWTKADSVIRFDNLRVTPLDR